MTQEPYLCMNIISPIFAICKSFLALLSVLQTAGAFHQCTFTLQSVIQRRFSCALPVEKKVHKLQVFPSVCAQ